MLDPQDKKVVGFKLKHDELVLPEFTALRDEIANDLDFRIIHLWRENLLRRFLSHCVVNRLAHTTLVVEGQPMPAKAPPIRLDPLECERDFETTIKRDAEFRELFARHRSFSLSYEEMVARDPKKIDALQNFLGVSPRIHHDHEETQ